MSDSGSKQTRSKVSIALAVIGLGIGWLRVSIALVVTGFGIGWLAGLSVSPVVSIVITSVTGVAGAVVAALSGLKEAAPEDETTKTKHLLRLRIDPVPIGLLAAGLILGSIVGPLARNYHLLGSDLSAELTKWDRAGLAKTEVARRLLDLHYPPAAYMETLKQASGATNTAQYIRGTALLGSGAVTTADADCDDLRGKRDAALQDQLGKTQWQALPAIITDTAKLKRIVDEVLCKE